MPVETAAGLHASRHDHVVRVRLGPRLHEDVPIFEQDAARQRAEPPQHEPTQLVQERHLVHEDRQQLDLPLRPMLALALQREADGARAVVPRHEDLSSHAGAASCRGPPRRRLGVRPLDDALRLHRLVHCVLMQGLALRIRLAAVCLSVARWPALHVGQQPAARTPTALTNTAH
eukprot:scaffold64529_cov74-Phaeocystis_antarctica.AAC.3